MFSVAAILSGIFKIDDVYVMAKLAKKIREAFKNVLADFVR